MNGFATVQPGFEPALLEELQELGFQPAMIPGGARFAATPADIARVAKTARTPTAVYAELVEAPTRTPEELVALVRKVNWKEWLLPDARVNVVATTKGSRMRFKDGIEGKVGHALADARKGPRIPEREARPRQTQTLRVRVEGTSAMLSLDAGGELLHKRGWRTEAVGAPIRENLAAALLFTAGWHGADVLCDPFCGSGTIAIEAALLAAGRAPFARRDFACDEWAAVANAGRGGHADRGGARGAFGGPPRARFPPKNAGSRGPTSPARKGSPVAIYGFDKDPRALVISAANAERAGVKVHWRACDIADLQAPASMGTVVTNPPWGMRLGQSVASVYHHFGVTMRERFPGWPVFFLSPDMETAKRVDPKVRRIVVFPSGGLRVGLYVVEPTR